MRFRYILKYYIYTALGKRVPSEYVWKIRSEAVNQKWYRQIYNKLMEKNNASIVLEANIEEKPIFPHGLNGILISQGAKIGKKCVIFHQVTIGSNTLLDSKNHGSPNIGDNVYIGAGAKIIGNVKVGNNVRIGANCVVTKDIPNNCTVVMSSPIVIAHDEVKDNTFISWNEYQKMKV